MGYQSLGDGYGVEMATPFVAFGWRCGTTCNLFYLRISIHVFLDSAFDLSALDDEVGEKVWKQIRYDMDGRIRRCGSIAVLRIDAHPCGTRRGAYDGSARFADRLLLRVLLIASIRNARA
jgi:hypothetical protein